MLAVVSWTGQAHDDLWTSPHNWSTQQVPGITDDVIINISSTGTTIQLSAGTQAINSLTSNTPIIVSGSGTLAITGTATLSAAITLSGGTLQGGDYSNPGSFGIVLTTGGGTLNGVTVDTNVDGTASEAFAEVINGLTLNGTAELGGPGAVLSRLEFDGTQTLAGTGIVLFGSVFANGPVTAYTQLPIEPGLIETQSGATLTLGPTITVRGAGNRLPPAAFSDNYAVIGYAPSLGGPTDVSVVNQGTIEAEPTSLALSQESFLGIRINAQTFTNFGTVGFNGLSVFGVAGTLQALAGSALVNDSSASTSVTLSGGNVQFSNNPFASGGSSPFVPPEFLGRNFVSVPPITLSAQAVLNVPPGAVYVMGPVVFSGSNAAINLASDNVAPSGLLLAQDVEFTGASGSAGIYSTGTGNMPGILDLGNINYIPPVTIGPARNFTVNGTAHLTITAKIYGAALQKDGTGELEFQSGNAYANGTVLSNGITEIDDPGALGSGSVTFAGGSLALRTGGAAISNPIMVDATDTVALDVGAAAMQMAIPELGTALDITGTAGGSLSLNGPIALQNNLIIDNTVPLTINGTISGSFGITKTDTGTLTLAGSSSNTYTGPTTVNSGTLLLDDSGGAVTIPDALSIVPFAGAGVATAATVRLLAGQQLSSNSTLNFDSTNGAATLDLNGFNQGVQSLTIANPGGSAFIGSGATGTAGSGMLTANSLSIASGQTLDLTDNNLQVSYTSGNNPIAAIRNYLSNGYGGGAWNGNGTAGNVGRIISSTAAAAGRTLGYADSADNVVAGLASNTILVKYTIPGDANLDGSVNFSDLVILAQHYGANATWDQGDFGYGGKVNFADLVALAQNYNKSAGAAAVSATAALTPGLETGGTVSDTSLKSRHRSVRHGGASKRH